MAAGINLRPTAKSHHLVVDDSAGQPPLPCGPGRPPDGRGDTEMVTEEGGVGPLAGSRLTHPQRPNGMALHTGPR